MAQLCTALTHPTVTTTITTNTDPIPPDIADAQSATTTLVTNVPLVTDTHATTTISNIEDPPAITTHPAIKSSDAHHYTSAIDTTTNSLSAITTSGHPTTSSTLIGLDTFSSWPGPHNENAETLPFLSTHPIESTHLRHNWTAPQPELEPHSYAQPRAPPQTQSEIDSFSYTQPHPQSELDTFSYTQPYTQEELHSHTYLQTDVESHTYTQAQTHSEIESHSYVQSELGTHSYAQLQTQAELNSHSYSQAALEPHSYAQVEQETHSYTQLHTQPALESHSYTQLHSQPFTQSELDMHLYAQGELDAHSYAQAELESHSYAQAHTLQVHSYTQSRALSTAEPLFMEGSHASSSLDHDSLHESLQEPDLNQGLASHSNSDALSGSFLGSVPAVWDQMDPLVDGISEAESDQFGTDVVRPRTSRSPFSRSGTGFCGSFPGHYGPTRGGRGPGSLSPSSHLPAQEGQTPGPSKRVARKEPRRGVRGRGGGRRGSRLPVGAGLGPPTYEAISSGYRVLGWSSGQKVYACEDCGYHTPRRGRMFTHRERHHHPVLDGALLEKVMSGESSHSSQILQSPPLRMDSSAIGRGGRGGRGGGRGRGTGRGPGRGRGPRSQRLIVETAQLIPNAARAGRAGRGGTWIGVRSRGQRTRKSGMDRMMASDHATVSRTTRGMKRPGNRTRDIMPGSVEDRIVGLGRAASGITGAYTTLRGARMRTRARRGRGSQVLCGVAYRRAGAGRFQCLFCPFVSAHRRSTSRHVLKFHLPNRTDKPDQKSCYNPNPDFFEPPDDVIKSDIKERPANRRLDEEEDEDDDEEEEEEEEDSGCDDYEQQQDGNDKKKEQIEDYKEDKLVLDNRGGAKLDEIMENPSFMSTVGAVEEAIEIKKRGIVGGLLKKSDGERQEQKKDEENEKKTVDKGNNIGFVIEVDKDQKTNVFEDSKKQVNYGIKTNGVEQNCETLESKFKMKGRGGKGLVSRGRRGRLLAEILGRVASSRKANVRSPDEMESRMGLGEQDAMKKQEFPSQLIDADASHSTSRLTPTKRSAVVNESAKMVEHPLFPHKRHRIDAIVGQLTGRLNSIAQQQTRTSLLALSSVEGLGMGGSSGDSDVESINSSTVTDPHDAVSELQVDQGNESQTSEGQQGVSGSDKVTAFPYRCKRCIFTCCLARALTTHYHRAHPYLQFSPSFVLDPTDHSAMFRCVHCRCSQFGNETALRDHYTEQHPGVISPLDYDNSPQLIRYRCLLCPFVHASARGLSPHYYKAHPGIRVTPALLSSGLVSSGSEADGWVEDSTSHGLVFSCDLCSYQNGNIHSVLNHYQRRHPGSKASFSRIKKLEFSPGNPSKAQISPKGHQVSPQEIEGNPDVSILYHCRHCGYENRTVQGVLVHYQKRHPEIKVTANYIRRGVSPIRPRTSLSPTATLTVSSPASTPPAVIPQPVPQTPKPILGPSGMPGLQFYCRECPYINRTVQGILVHCQKRHPGLRISGELVREYTAIIWSRMEVGQQSAPDATGKEPVAVEGGRSGMTRCTDCGHMCSTARQLSLHRAKRHSFRTSVEQLKVEQGPKVMSEVESVMTGVRSAGGSCEGERVTSGRSPKVPNEDKPKSAGQQKPRKVVLSRGKPLNQSMSLITGSTFGCGVPLRAVPGMYSCNICPYVNARLHGVLTHYQKKHPAVRVTGEVFSRGGQPPPQALLNHLAQVASKVTYGGYMCQLCQFAHPAFEKLVAHMKRSHGDALMAGSHGSRGKVLVGSTQSPPTKVVFEEEHQKEAVNPGRSRLQEEVGGGVLESQPPKEGILMQMSKQGRTALDGAWRARSCPRCGRAFSSRQTLRAHAHSHLLATLVQLQPARSHSCDRCSFATALRFRLARHKQNTHPPPPFWRCPHCPLRAPNPWHLAGHCHRVHRTPRIWCCSLCSYATLYHAALNHHHQLHHNQLSRTQQPNTSTVCVQPPSSQLLGTCPTNLLHSSKPSGMWQSSSSVPGCHDLPPILPVMGDEGGDRETSADSPPLLIAQELGKEQVKDVVEGTPHFVQELKDNEPRNKGERLKPLRGTIIPRKIGGLLHRVADDKMVKKEKVTKKEKTRDGGWGAVVGERFVLAGQRVAKLEGARSPAPTPNMAATTADGNTPLDLDDSRMYALVGSDESRIRASAGSDEGRVGAPAATDGYRTCTPAASDEGRGRACAVGNKDRAHVCEAVDEGRVCVPVASDEGIMRMPAAFDEGVVHVLAASEEMALAASEKGMSHAPATTEEGTSHAPTTTDEGTSHVPATTDEGTSRAPATTDEVMSPAPATTDEGTSPAPATTDEGKSRAPATTDEGTARAPVTTDEGTARAPATMDEGTSRALTTTDEGTAHAPAVSGKGTSCAPLGEGTLCAAAALGDGKTHAPAALGDGASCVLTASSEGMSRAPASLEEGTADGAASDEGTADAPSDEWIAGAPSDEKTEGAPSDEGTLCAPSASDEWTAYAPAVSDEGTVCAPTVSDEGTSCAPTVSDEGTAHAPTVSDEGTAHAPTVSDEGTARAPTVSDEGTARAPTVSDEGTARAPTVSDEGKARVPTVSDGGTARVPVVSDEGTAGAASDEEMVGAASAKATEGAPVAFEEGTVGAPAVSEEGTSCAPTVSGEGTSCAPTVSDEGTSCAPTVSDEGTVRAPTVSDEGTARAPTVSDEGTAGEPMIPDEEMAGAPAVSDERTAGAASDEEMVGAASAKATEGAPVALEEGTVGALAVCDEGTLSALASAVSDEGTVDAPVASDDVANSGEGTAAAPSKKGVVGVASYEEKMVATLYEGMAGAFLDWGTAGAVSDKGKVAATLDEGMAGTALEEGTMGASVVSDEMAGAPTASGKGTVGAPSFSDNGTMDAPSEEGSPRAPAPSDEWRLRTPAASDEWRQHVPAASNEWRLCGLASSDEVRMRAPAASDEMGPRVPASSDEVGPQVPTDEGRVAADLERVTATDVWRLPADEGRVVGVVDNGSALANYGNVAADDESVAVDDDDNSQVVADDDYRAVAEVDDCRAVADVDNGRVAVEADKRRAAAEVDEGGAPAEANEGRATVEAGEGMVAEEDGKGRAAADKVRAAPADEERKTVDMGRADNGSAAMALDEDSVVARLELSAVFADVESAATADEEFMAEENNWLTEDKGWTKMENLTASESIVDSERMLMTWEERNLKEDAERTPVVKAESGENVQDVKEKLEINQCRFGKSRNDGSEIDGVMNVCALGLEKGKGVLEEDKGADRLLFHCLLCGLESHCRQLTEAHLKEEHKVRQNLSLVIHTTSSSS
uniref:uncharacterized protein isoform X1 n=2 Tax=Myxine glutinosa TaxID=7769 RepID=UPI00358FE72E